jgi:hypothetical protein
MAAPENSLTAHARVVSRAWTDPAFRGRLTSDPKAALKEEGIQLPDDVQVKVLQNTPTLQHLVLPVAPPSGATTPGGGVPSSALGIIGGGGPADGIIGGGGAAEGIIGGGKAADGIIGGGKAADGIIGGGKAADGIIGGGTPKPKP